ASPIHGLPSSVYFHINKEGTHLVVSACRATHTKELVYTSLTGIIWMGADLAGVKEDEVWIPSQSYDAYHHTKALAEQTVLDANGVDGMAVMVLRLCGMTRERNKQLIWCVAKLLEHGQENIQIGDNMNLIDYLYVGNAAHAHILGVDHLLMSPESIAGQVFFITNGQLMPQWPFNRLIFREVIWAKSEFNMSTVRFATGVQWYNIDKVCNLLGYEPKISLEEEICRTVQWWKASGAGECNQRKERRI
ncbi:NAD(P)-binding protein, partial [Guyanagaster necrorhizus]